MAVIIDQFAWRNCIPLSLLVLSLLVAGCKPRSTDDWLRQLNDPDVAKRREAIRELGSKKLDVGRVVPALAEALKDESSYVRRDAALALGKFGVDAQPCVPALVATLADKESSVRSAATSSLKKIDPAAAKKAEVP